MLYVDYGEFAFSSFEADVYAKKLSGYTLNQFAFHSASKRCTKK